MNRITISSLLFAMAWKIHWLASIFPDLVNGDVSSYQTTGDFATNLARENFLTLIGMPALGIEMASK